MLTLMRWIGRQFRYFFYGKEEIIDKITDEKNNIPNNVRDELIQSVLQNKPEQFLKQVTSEKHISEDVRNELLKSVIIHRVQCDNVKQTHCDMSDMNKDIESIYKNMMDDYSANNRKNYPKDFDKNNDVLIKTMYHCKTLGEQLVKNTTRTKNWKKKYNTVMEQLDFKNYISTHAACEVIGNVQPIKTNRRNNTKIANKRERYSKNRTNRANLNYNNACNKNKILKMECKWNQHY